MVHEGGGPEVLKLEEAPLPEPGRGEVLVRIDVAAVGFADVLRRTGGYPVRAALPAILGTRMAGTVEKVGPDVDASLVGTCVAGSVSGGSYALADAAKAHLALENRQTVGKVMLLPHL